MFRTILLMVLLFFPLLAFSADGESTGYFGALWDFIDWVYEALDEFKQTVLDYLAELGLVIVLWYVEWKIAAIELMWSIAEPLIDSLNLTDVISSLFGGLSNDVKMFITELRIGEAVNLMLSAYATRMLLRITGF